LLHHALEELPEPGEVDAAEPDAEGRARHEREVRSRQRAEVAAQLREQAARVEAEAQREVEVLALPDVRGAVREGIGQADALDDLRALIRRVALREGRAPQGTEVAEELERVPVCGPGARAGKTRAPGETARRILARRAVDSSLGGGEHAFPIET